MPIRAGFKWYDGFFLSMLAFSVLIIVLNWERYEPCKLPLHIWIVVDYAAAFLFRLLMFVDNLIIASIGLDDNRQLRGKRLFERLVVLSILYLGLYPFLWAWSVVGAIWFACANDCLPEKNEKWGMAAWLLFSFGGLICLAGNLGKKWLIRRRAHIRRAPPGARVSAFRVLLNMIRQPDLVYEHTFQDLRRLEQDTGLHDHNVPLESLRLALETMIQELPIFILRAIPTDCSDCPICLEEFRVGEGVRGLPCAHTFHVPCIDKWLRLNLKCPRCRCFVFHTLNINGQSIAIPVDPERSHNMRNSQSGSSYLARMQSFLIPVDAENAPSSEPNPSSSPSPSPGPGSCLSTTSAFTASNNSGTAAEIVENGDGPSEPADK